MCGCRDYEVHLEIRSSKQPEVSGLQLCSNQRLRPNTDLNQY
jgi:hypothetical protein